MNSTHPRALAGRVAVVTGASRGAGRGIAQELGAAGATVYVTGRSTRAQPAGSYQQILSMSGMERMPGTIDDAMCFNPSRPWKASSGPAQRTIRLWAGA